TGVQTCALPISRAYARAVRMNLLRARANRFCGVCCPCSTNHCLHRNSQQTGAIAADRAQTLMYAAFASTTNRLIGQHLACIGGCRYSAWAHKRVRWSVRQLPLRGVQAWKTECDIDSHIMYPCLTLSCIQTDEDVNIATSTNRSDTLTQQWHNHIRDLNTKSNQKTLLR